MLGFDWLSTAPSGDLYDGEREGTRNVRSIQMTSTAED